MSEEHTWVVVDKMDGGLQAEIMRGLLEAQDIPVWLNQEGAGKAIGLTLPALGLVQVLVPSDKEQQAREIVEAYYAGTFESQGEEWNVDAGQDDAGGAEPSET